MPWSGTDRTPGRSLPPHALRLHPCGAEEEPTWREVLAAERRFAGGTLPRTIRLQPATVQVEESEEERLQNGAEYAADGLVPLVERLGKALARSVAEVVGEVIAHAAVETSHGPIPSTRAETNGNLLQVVARLYPLTRDGGQLEMAERIAAWYADDALAAQWLPRARDPVKSAPATTTSSRAITAARSFPASPRSTCSSASKEVRSPIASARRCTPCSDR